MLSPYILLVCFRFDSDVVHETSILVLGKDCFQEHSKRNDYLMEVIIAQARPAGLLSLKIVAHFC